MFFILNPYNNVLDPFSKDNMKLFKTGSKGPKEAQRFDGRKELFNNFTKLMSHKIEKVRLNKLLKNAMERDTSAAAPRPTKTTVNIFEKKAESKAL
eukprot:9661420-Ditylum_brightwellii.AAC.1